MDTRTEPRDNHPSRRGFLALAAASGAVTALGGLPAFAATPAPRRPTASPMLAPNVAAKNQLWWQAPGSATSMIEQGLPVGNGRLGALASNDPSRELLTVTDATLWTGGRNDTLDGDGQFPYGRDDFGSLTMLATLTVDIPGHDLGAVDAYRRTLDLAQGLVTTAYDIGGVGYRREIFASRPDDVIVLHFTQQGGGTYTGAISLAGTHGEATTADPTGRYASFGASFANGLRYGAAVTAHSGTGTVAVTGTSISFTDCRDLTVIVSGGTDYAPTAATGFRDPSVAAGTAGPDKVLAAARESVRELLHTHVADVRAGVRAVRHRPRHVVRRPARPGHLGADAGALARRRARPGAGGRVPPVRPLPDDLRVAGQSADRTPGAVAGRQRPGLDGRLPQRHQHPDELLAGRPGRPRRHLRRVRGLLRCAVAGLDRHDPAALQRPRRNRFRNTSGRIAGWAVAFSTNPYGGSGWWWHPAATRGCARTCSSTTSTPRTAPTWRRSTRCSRVPWSSGRPGWSPRPSPTRPASHARCWSPTGTGRPNTGRRTPRATPTPRSWCGTCSGTTAAATQVLGRDTAYARTIDGLRKRLYLPEVSPTSGWLQEWMSPDNLGETTHRHLSPLIGLFPGDRIRPDGSTPAEIVAGATALLTRAA